LQKRKKERKKGRKEREKSNHNSEWVSGTVQPQRLTKNYFELQETGKGFFPLSDQGLFQSQPIINKALCCSRVLVLQSILTASLRALKFSG
jgi:hypothetical protein